MTPVDPDQFIITRKRKKYKFAKFANAANCFEFEEWKAGAIGSSPAPDVIEVGAGSGMFMVELAAREPDKLFVAIDVKADRLQKGAYEALDRGILNIYFVRARADQVEELFKPLSLSTIWLTFSDPFPKKRSAGRRMTHRRYLDSYQRLLRSGSGRLLIKHDNPQFFQWSLEQLVGAKWRIGELSFDLHDSDLSDDYKIPTTYEQRWLGEGRTTQFVSAHPR